MDVHGLTSSNANEVHGRQLTSINKRVSDLFREADGHRRVHSGTVE